MDNRALGPKGPWAKGPLGPRALGPKGSWTQGPLGPGALGPKGPWAQGPLERVAQGGGRVAVSYTHLTLPTTPYV